MTDKQIEKIREELKDMPIIALEMLSIAEQKRFNEMFPDHWLRAYVIAQLTGDYDFVIDNLEITKTLIDGFLISLKGLRGLSKGEDVSELLKKGEELLNEQ